MLYDWKVDPNGANIDGNHVISSESIVPKLLALNLGILRLSSYLQIINAFASEPL